MDRSQSACFQQVEDWLRGLGLLQYAQSFYDNGYEDIETCKEITVEDLDVIGVKGTRDRNDILVAVERLKQNVYFVLEAEPTEKPEPVKFESVILKSKLKESLKVRNVQLIEPPYYNPDGTFGDLYPLAITLADDLGTHFTDVLDALDQLRIRQLPVQTYDVMSTENTGRDGDEKASSTTPLNDPAEYLNCEMNDKNRGYSFSKYDTRVTKSTTDLTKDIHHERSHSAGNGNNRHKINPPHKANSEKGKSRFSIFHRSTVKNKNKEQQHEFKADDLAMSQSEICDMFSKVKKNEMSQEEVLAAVKKRSGSGDRQHSITSIQSMPEQSNNNAIHSGSLGKSRKSKINKNMIKRTPSATFYTKDDTPYILPAGDASPLERTRSGSSLGGDDDSSKSSPELGGKAGILSKIRSSMRKKGKGEGGDDCSLNSSLSPSDSVSSQENIASSDVSGKNSPEVRRHDVNVPPPVPPNKPEKGDPSLSGVYQHPTPILVAAGKATPPVPPVKPKDLKKVEDDWEVFGDEASDGGDPPLKIKEYTKYQDESSRRHDEVKPDEPLPGKGMTLNLKEAKLKPIPKAPPRITKTSASSDESRQSPLASPSQNAAGQKPPDSHPSPVAPPRVKKPINQGSASKTTGTAGTPTENIGIDDIGEKMDSLIAGLNDRLNDIDDNYVDDSQLDNMRNSQKNQQPIKKPPQIDAKKPVPRPVPPGGKPITTAKRPMLPPRPSGSTPPRKSSVDVLDIDNRPSKPPHGRMRGNSADENTHRDHESKKTDDVIEQVSQELEQFRKASISSQNRNKIGIKSRFKVFPLKRIIQKKLQNENVLVHESPYTSKDGTWQIPHALVKRYSDELSCDFCDVVKSLEEIRSDECKKNKKPLILYKDMPSPQVPNNSSLDEWLISVGLPMFIGDLRECEVTTIDDVYLLKEKDFLQIGVFHDTHVALLMAFAKEQVTQSQTQEIVYC